MRNSVVKSFVSKIKGFISSVRLGDREANMLWTIFVVLLVLWLLGFSLHIGGALIHLLLVVGLVVLVINLLSGRRSAV
jgi:1,4-dihydroxy-2-naphthoate octaprenyltransferase